MRNTDRPAFVGRIGPLLQLVRLLRAVWSTMGDPAPSFPAGALAITFA
jgi:hypothetical protein